MPPGTGWPGDPATAATPVALGPADVERLARDAADAVGLDARASVCRACPRLVEWREEVARVRRAAYADQRYWGRPMPSFGPADARVLLVGLAPAAHGGNRTGRIFTGDRSGDWLFAALHRVGLAELPTSTSAGDGQRMLGTRVLAAVRCAPPANKPTPQERDACRPWLVRELELLRPTLRAIVVLGGFAWQALWPTLAAAGFPPPARRPVFGHGARVESPGGGPLVLGCYHPSQQNTFTGRVTAAMLEEVLAAAARHAGLLPPSPAGS
ncbi:uracil-DNA glycosylase [Frankia nepalensis]|uniref:uracil-DNA glycosylase n=1 Tax=Frankia nepalensis TaxID=1836974 RepID=UPI0028896C3E|nr:uracil-DNA glycosylase [Frankia nepalensis]